jgi:hypothetical protein
LQISLQRGHFTPMPSATPADALKNEPIFNGWASELVNSLGMAI